MPGTKLAGQVKPEAQAEPNVGANISDKCYHNIRECRRIPKMSILASAVPQVAVCIFRIKNKQPTMFVLYDTDNIPQCVDRIIARHPDYEYLTAELIPSKAEAANFTRSFNKMMLFYEKFITAYGSTSKTV